MNLFDKFLKLWPFKRAKTEPLTPEPGQPTFNGMVNVIEKEGRTMAFITREGNLKLKSLGTVGEIVKFMVAADAAHEVETRPLESGDSMTRVCKASDFMAYKALVRACAMAISDLSDEKRARNPVGEKPEAVQMKLNIRDAEK